MPSSPPKPVAPAPAPAAPAISDAEKRAAEARAKMEEINRKRSEDAQKKAAYQEWIKQHDAPPGDDGIQVSDMGVMRTSEWVRTLDDGPDPPRGRDSTVNHWFPDHLKPDLGNLAARQSVRVQVNQGIIEKSIGFDAAGNFHPIRHFHAGSAYERYRRGMPPGYMGHIPNDATPVTGGKIGVIEKKHPLLYSYVRPATGAVVADLMDDKVVSAGVGDSMDADQEF